MPLVNYENDSSDEENEQEENTNVVTHQLNPPKSSQTTVKKQDDEQSSNLLANLPKPQENSSTTNPFSTMEFPEDELEDIVRVENKAYAKDLPQAPKPIKRKRDGPVKIFLPTVEQDSDDEDKPKRKVSTIKRNCALLNALPPPIHDEDKPSNSMPVVSNPSAKTPQITSTGLFIPHTVSQKKTTKTTTTAAAAASLQQPTKTLVDIEDDDDDDDGTDFLGLTKSDQIQISSTDVESVLRETFPKARPTHVEQPILPAEPLPSAYDFEDLDNDNDDEDNIHQSTTMINDDDELLKYLPKSERYKEIKSVHIDSMLGETARLQLLKNVTEERDTIKAQAAIQVPKGEVRKRAQITYLIAKAKSDDLRLKNMWSEQKLTKKQTQAKYGF